MRILAASALLIFAATGVARADLAGEAGESVGSTSERALWEFQVLLDGREIGYHSFDVLAQGNVEQVDIKARFEVEVFFVTAYRYEHDNQETWHGDCLQQIASSTDDNGDQYAIAGQAGDAGFTLDRNEVSEALDTTCLKTFAYWNPEILEADKLLNAQTGEWKSVTVEAVGAVPFEVAGVPVPSEEYRLVIPDGVIRLWYQQDNQQWLGLETETKGGRTLRYEPLSVPSPPASLADTKVARRAGASAGMSSR